MKMEVRDLTAYHPRWINFTRTFGEAWEALKTLDRAREDARPLRFRFSGPDAERAAAITRELLEAPTPPSLWQALGLKD